MCCGVPRFPCGGGMGSAAQQRMEDAAAANLPHIVPICALHRRPICFYELRWRRLRDVGGSVSDKTHKRNAFSHVDWLEKRPFVRFINVVVNIVINIFINVVVNIE